MRVYKLSNLLIYFIYKFLFSSDSQPVHNERQIVKVVGPVLEKKERYELPPDIDQHGFSKFSNIYFKVNTK